MRLGNPGTTGSSVQAARRCPASTGGGGSSDGGSGGGELLSSAAAGQAADPWINLDPTPIKREMDGGLRSERAVGNWMPVFTDEPISITSAGLNDMPRELPRGSLTNQADSGRGSRGPAHANHSRRIAI